MSLALTMLLDRYMSGKPTMEAAADSIGLNGSTCQAPRLCHPSFVKITFPFSQAAHVTLLPSASSYRARVPGHFQAHLRASYEESCHNGERGWRFRREFPAFSATATIAANVECIFSPRSEEFRPRNSPSRLPYTPWSLAGDINEDRRYFSPLSI